MNGPRRVAIVHYHLKRGGVTRVIASTLRALAARGDGPVCVALAGEAPAEGDFPGPARAVEGLAYSNAQARTPAPAELVGRLRAAAREALGGDPDVWHIHNPTLGKNRAMAGAVSLLAEAGEALLLHFHDFAEGGRPENYRLLREWSDTSDGPYPVAPRVAYAVLNARDADVLRAAGAPPARLHLAANPVEGPPAPIAPPGAADARALLRKLGARKLWLYPVRAVRRKNFGELMLWAALAGEGEVFANTLGPTNREARARYEAWRDFAGRHRLPVRFGIGESGAASFDALMAAADRVLTTSVAEGFGLAFLEPWLHGKAPAGRDLPVVSADFKAAGIDLSGLYPALPVPEGWIDAGSLADRLGRAMRAAAEAYRTVPPADGPERALAAIRPSPGWIDFGGLDEVLQESVLRRVLADPSARRALPELPPAPAAETVAANAHLIRERHGPRAYAARLADIYATLADAPREKPDHLDPRRVLEGFLKPESFRLLCG